MSSMFLSILYVSIRSPLCRLLDSEYTVVPNIQVFVRSLNSLYTEPYNFVARLWTFSSTSISHSFIFVYKILQIRCPNLNTVLKVRSNVCGVQCEKHFFVQSVGSPFDHAEHRHSRHRIILFTPFHFVCFKSKFRDLFLVHKTDPDGLLYTSSRVDAEVLRWHVLHCAIIWEWTAVWSMER